MGKVGTRDRSSCRRRSPRVRRPDVGLTGARRELLLVDPVEPAVQQRVGAALGEPRLAAGRDVDDVEVALAHEGDALLKQHGVRKLFTRDVDFRKFPFLDVRDPFAL
jgi:hypothetical protein